MLTTENRLRAKLEKKISFSEVGGLHKQIETLESILLSPVRNEKGYQEIGKYPPSGVLIYGLPGTGKTMLINAFANKYAQELAFFWVDCKSLLAKQAQESELKLNELLDQATEQAPRSVLVFDDIKFIFPTKRNQQSETEKRCLLSLCKFFDDLLDKRRVVIIGITNSLDDVHTDLRRSKRFDIDIEFTVPIFEERLEILDCILKRCEHKILFHQLKEFARNLIAYTGSDIDLIVSFAAMAAVEARRKALTLADLKEAAAKVKPSAMREIMLEVPAVRWTDIGGMELVKTKLIECLIWPIKYKHIYDRFNEVQPKGVLMYGPPGCSKTMIGKALATECKHRFLSIKGPEIFSKYVGESERAVRDLFAKARQIAPSIIFFDEIDAIAVNRSSDVKSANSVNDKVVSTLLNELDGIEKLSNVFVVATTNRPDVIDHSLLRTGRLDSIIYVPLPDFATRKEIFRIKISTIPYQVGAYSAMQSSLDKNLNMINSNLNGMKICDDLDSTANKIANKLDSKLDSKLDTKSDTELDTELSALAKKTEGYSGAEIITICHEAFLIGMRSIMPVAGQETSSAPETSQDLLHLSFEHYSRAIDTSKPRTSKEMINLHKEFAERFCHFDLLKSDEETKMGF